MKEVRKMKISIDIDGTLWQHQDLFRAFSWAMKAAGHEIGICTGQLQESKENNLRAFMRHGFPEFDFFYGRPDESWAGADHKKKMIAERGIDYHFDDFDFSHESSLMKAGKHIRFIRMNHGDPSVHSEIYQDTPPIK